MITLGIDTSTNAASVALWDHARGTLLGEATSSISTHSEQVLVMVEKLLSAAGLSPANLDLLVVGAGPGSFTGLRIGLSTAKGLCFALDKPLVQVSSLGAMALAVGDAPCVCATLDAYKAEVYAGIFRVRAGRVETLAPENALAPAALAAQLAELARVHGEVLIVGNVFARYPSLRDVQNVRAVRETTPCAIQLVQLGIAQFLDVGGESVAGANPHYLRASEAELARDKKNA